MGGKSFLGEFEQMVLLAVLQCGSDAFGMEVREELSRSAGRAVSRGAFYTTMDRLEAKGLVGWQLSTPKNARGGGAQRLFVVTPEGVVALRDSKAALVQLWRDLDHVLGES